MTNRRLHIGAGVQGGGTFANSPLGAPVPAEALEFRWGETPTYVTATGTWTVPEDYDGYVLVYAIGGGGTGGSGANGSGGGAGGCALSVFKAIPGTTFNVTISSGVCTISQSALLEADMVANKGGSGTGASGGAGGTATGGNIGAWTGGVGGLYNGGACGGGGGVISNDGLTANGGTHDGSSGNGGGGAGWAVQVSSDGASTTVVRTAGVGGIGFSPTSDFISGFVETNIGVGYTQIGYYCGGHGGASDGSGGSVIQPLAGKNFAGGGGAHNGAGFTSGGAGGYGGGGGGGNTSGGAGGAAVAVFIISPNGKWF